LHAVLDTKTGSGYDDLVSQRYHFPKRYLGIIERSLGDWVIYREPRAGGGSMAYIATARIDKIIEDRDLKNHYYALVTDFQEFDFKVPWTVDGIYWEDALRRIETPKVGVYMRGRSVRELSNDDFDAIVTKAFGFDSIHQESKVVELTPPYLEPHEDEQKDDTARRTVQVLTNKKLRDHRFRNRILKAYDGFCAITKVKIADYKGNYEAQAAHILPVANNGPDIVSNGLALSNTVHWMFDRHLISVDQNYKLLVAETKIPDKYMDLIEPASNGILLPQDSGKRPNQAFLEEHRSQFNLKQRLNL